MPERHQPKIAVAMQPLLRFVGLSESGVPWLATQLRKGREVWKTRSLAGERLAQLFLGFVVPVRRDGRVVRQQSLVALCLVARETLSGW